MVQIDNCIRAIPKDTTRYDTRDKMTYYKTKCGPGAIEGANFEYIKKYQAAGSFVMTLTGITDTKIYCGLTTFSQAFSRILFLQPYWPYVDRYYHYDGHCFFRVYPKFY